MKLIHLSIAAAAIILSNQVAKAFTVHDLVKENGIYAIQNLYWSQNDRYFNGITNKFDFNDVPLGDSKGIHFEYVRDAVSGNIQEKYVKVVGFRAFNWHTPIDKDYIFTIADENNKPSTDGTRLLLFNDNIPYGYENCVSTDGKWMLGAVRRADVEWQLDMLGAIAYYYSYATKSKYTNSYTVQEKQWVGEMSTNAEGNIQINFKNGVILWDANGSASTIQGNISHRNDRILDRVDIETYRPAAFFTVTEHPYIRVLNERNNSYYDDSYFSTQGTERTFPVKIRFNSDGTFEMLNLTGNGYAIRSNIEIKNDEGEVIESYRSLPRVMTGHTDEYGNMVLDGGQEIDFYFDGNGGYQYRGEFFTEVLASLPDFPKRKPLYDDIKASVTKTGTLEHRYDDNRWVSPGTCRTFITNAIAEFPTFAYVHHDETIPRYESSPAYTGGTLAIDEMDVTLDCELTYGELGYSETQLWPRFTFMVNANDTYVDSYTLWMIPMSRFESNDVNVHPDFDHENGHTHGFPVATVSKDDFVSTGADGGHYPVEYYIERLFNKSEMPETDPDNRYMYYIQANYADVPATRESERQLVAPRAALEPTFHSLTSINVTTSCDDISMLTPALNVTPGVGYATIGGTDSDITIFTVDGKTVYNGAPGTISLTRGMYVVRSAGASVKFIVK